MRRKGFDSLKEKVGTVVSKELKVSIKKPNQREQDTRMNAYNRVEKQINEEICFNDAIKQKVKKKMSKCG